MNISVLDFFTIGIGPSSSHTVGPMVAAREFAMKAEGFKNLHRLRCDLFGSLAATGKGHGTDQAILLGWMGEAPDQVDVDSIPRKLDNISNSNSITLAGGGVVLCDPREAIVFHRTESLPRHPNGMHFTALDSDEEVLCEEIVYSLGGGFIRRESEWVKSENESAADVAIPFPFTCADELLELCRSQEMSISSIALANENALRPEEETRARLDTVWQAMRECVERGCKAKGVLPGGLKVKRRANQVMQDLEREETNSDDPLRILDWVNLFALAVNEENAAGGRVVTAPTNGAAGVLPAVLHYACRFKISPHSGRDSIHRFLLTAGALAMLYKRNASLSGADVGCQGEVGVACSMAAGALVEFLGGSPEQVECAAEIGMEHNLGLTCDPVGGLVQIPCIERNAMASVKAINAARLAMRGDGDHVVSLDKVITTMRDTGRDMMEKYKETSRGGLAVNVIEC